MLRRLMIGIVIVVTLVVVVAVVARFSGGPIGPFPGGKLSGVRVAETVRDWAPILDGASHVELEVDPASPRSLTTSYILRDGVLYVPSMLAAHKSWPQEVLA